MPYELTWAWQHGVKLQNRSLAGAWHEQMLLAETPMAYLSRNMQYLSCCKYLLIVSVGAIGQECLLA